MYPITSKNSGGRGGAEGGGGGWGLLLGRGDPGASPPLYEILVLSHGFFHLGFPLFLL